MSGDPSTGCSPSRVERGRDGLDLGKGCQLPVLIHDLPGVVIAALRVQRVAGVTQSILRHGIEVFVPAREASQPGVFKLFASPKMADDGTFARPKGFTTLDDRMDIEQVP